MIYFKVKSKLIKHKNYSFIILDFHTGVGKKNTLLRKYKLVRMKVIMRKDCFLEHYHFLLS